MLHEALFERLGRRTHVDAVSAGKAPGRGDIAVAENGVDRAAAPSCCRPSGPVCGKGPRQRHPGRLQPDDGFQPAVGKGHISLQRAGRSGRRCCLALVPLAQFLQREGCQLQPWRVLPQPFPHGGEQVRPRPARKGPRSAVVQPRIGRPVNGVIGSVIVVQSLVCPWPVSAACLRSLSAARHLPERDAGQRQTPLRRVE